MVSSCHSTVEADPAQKEYGEMVAFDVPAHLAGDVVPISFAVTTPESSGNADGVTVIGVPVDFSLADPSAGRIVGPAQVTTAKPNFIEGARATVNVELLKEGNVVVNASVAGATWTGPLSSTPKPLAASATVKVLRPGSIVFTAGNSVVIEKRAPKFTLKPHLMSTSNEEIASFDFQWTCPTGESVVAMTNGSACNTVFGMADVAPQRAGTATFHVALPPALAARFPISADVQVTVTNPVARIELTAGPLSAGSTVTVTPAFRDAAGTLLPSTLLEPISMRPLANELAWTSSDHSVATVDPHGVVTGVAPDEVTISADYLTEVGPAVSPGSIKIAVGPNANVLTVIPSAYSMVVGGFRGLNAKITDPSGREIFAPITWLSRDVSVAQVDAFLNVVRALSTGPISTTPSTTVQLIARAAGAQGVANVTVYRSVATIVVNPPTSTMRTGQRAQFTAMLFDGSGNVIPNSATTVSWIALDPANATVDETGAVTAAAPSTTPARIRVSEAGGASVVASITVLPPASTVSLAIANGASTRPVNTSETLGVGTSAQLVATLKDANGATINDALTFTTSSSAIATVTSTGANTATVAGVASGTATIRVARTSDPTSFATATFVVSSATTGGPATRLVITSTPASATTTIGGTVTFNASALDASGNPASDCASVNWATDASLIASIVSSGGAAGISSAIATGVGAGTTAVRAFCADHSNIGAAARLIVTGATGVSQVNITPRFVYLAGAGASQVYSAALLPAGNTTAIEWVLLQSPAGVLTAAPSGTNNANVTIAVPAGAGTAIGGGARVVARAGGQSDTSWVTYGNAGSIKGTVVSTSAQYLGGLTATATLAGGGSSVTGGVNNEGIFYLAGLPVGTYTVTVRQQGNPTAQTIANVVVTTGGTALLTLAPFP